MEAVPGRAARREVMREASQADCSCGVRAERPPLEWRRCS